ncbi:MAG: hypothetical protein WAM70_10070, partial [Pyrinomonadaceae bacterium]
MLSASSTAETTRIIRRKDSGMAWRLIDGHDNGKSFLETSDYSQYEFRARDIYEIDRFGSVLEVPMVWLNETIGVLFVAAEPGRKFGEFSATRLQRIADLATLAIQRFRLLERIEKISDASFEFSKSLDTQSLNSRLTAIARAATDILGAEMCGVFRIRDWETMTLEASYGHRPGGFPIAESFHIRDQEHSGLTGALAYRLRAQFLEAQARGETGSFKRLVNVRESDLANDQAVRGDDDNSPSGHCFSLLAVPLISIPPSTPSITGLLRVSNKKSVSGLATSEVTFTKEDEWILRIFAEVAAIAIETAELFSKRDAELRLYRTLSEVLTGDADLDSQMDVIARQLAALLKKTYCRILFCDDITTTRMVVRGVGLHPRMNGQLVWEPHKGAALENSSFGYFDSLSQGAPEIFCASAQKNAAALLSSSQSVKVGNLQMIVAVPLLLNSRIVGAVEFGELRDPAKGRAGLSEEEVDLIGHPASLIAELLRRDKLWKRQSQMLEAFDSSVARIREEENLEDLFPLILREAGSLLAYDSAHIIVRRFRGGPIEVHIETGAFCCLYDKDPLTNTLFEKTFANPTKLDHSSLKRLVLDLGIGSPESSFLSTRLHNGTQSPCALVLT